MISNGQPIQQLLTRLIRKTRGGDTRTQILEALKENPQNTNQLAMRLKKSYKTIQHHITVLKKNKLITPVGDNYATTYFLSEPMEENYEVFQEITNEKSCKRKKRYCLIE